MKKYLLTAAALATFATPAFADKMICNMTDTAGNALTYEFGRNTPDSMVETGFVKNGRTTTSPVGIRPIWTVSKTSGNTWSMFSQEAPGWALNLVGDGDALLTHNRRPAGYGTCSTINTAANAPVGDVGITE
jgi:hypothetical protein